MGLQFTSMEKRLNDLLIFLHLTYIAEKGELILTVIQLYKSNRQTCSLKRI